MSYSKKRGESRVRPPQRIRPPPPFSLTIGRFLSIFADRCRIRMVSPLNKHGCPLADEEFVAVVSDQDRWGRFLPPAGWRFYPLCRAILDRRTEGQTHVRLCALFWGPSDPLTPPKGGPTGTPQTHLAELLGDPSPHLRISSHDLVRKIKKTCRPTCR